MGPLYDVCVIQGNVNTPASSRVIGSPLNDRAHHNGSEGRTLDYGYVTK